MQSLSIFQGDVTLLFCVIQFPTGALTPWLLSPHRPTRASGWDTVAEASGWRWYRPVLPLCSALWRRDTRHYSWWVLCHPPLQQIEDSRRTEPISCLALCSLIVSFLIIFFRKVLSKHLLQWIMMVCMFFMILKSFLNLSCRIIQLEGTSETLKIPHDLENDKIEAQSS